MTDFQAEQFENTTWSRGLRLVGTESRKRKQDKRATERSKAQQSSISGGLHRMNRSQLSCFSSHLPWSFLIYKCCRSYCSTFPVSEEVFAEKNLLFPLL